MDTSSKRSHIFDPEALSHLNYSLGGAPLENAVVDKFERLSLQEGMTGLDCCCIVWMVEAFLEASALMLDESRPMCIERQEGCPERRKPQIFCFSSFVSSLRFLPFAMNFEVVY